MVKRTSKLHNQLREMVMSDPESRAEYEAFKLQLALAEKMKNARTRAHLTQEAVAEKMGVSIPLVARLEAAGGKDKHSPSLKTLTRYLNAIGYHLQFKIVRNINETI